MTEQQGLDPAIPRSLIEALKSAFAVQASTPIEILRARALRPEAKNGIALASVIAMRSSAYTGELSIYFPARTYLGIVGKMLGEHYEAIDEGNADGARELLNIIYASARVKINENGHDFLPAIPTVIQGTDLRICHGKSVLSVQIDCQCEYGPFFLEVSLSRSGSTERRETRSAT